MQFPIEIGLNVVLWAIALPLLLASQLLAVMGVVARNGLHATPVMVGRGNAYSLLAWVVLAAAVYVLRLI